jgi:archaellum component FlaC
MCTAEDVTSIVKKEVAASERRLEEYIDNKFFERHKSNMDTFSNLMGDIQNRLKSLGDIMTNMGVTVSENKCEIKTIRDWKIAKEVTDTQVETDIASIKETLSKLMWIVITGVVVAVLGLILK